MSGLIRAQSGQAVSEFVTDALPDSSREVPRGLFARGAMRSIRVYQAARTGRPSPCRYLPTCSDYALEAIQRHGFLRGCLLGLRRISRCHPWGGHGLDPVPGVSRSR